MTTAQLSLLVSGAALAVSIIAAGWHVVRYLLEGGRVRVTFRRGWLNEHMLADAPFRRKDGHEDHGLPRMPGLHLEVAVMKVSNRGRTAVTISTPSLDISRERSWRDSAAIWRRRRWYRHTKAPRLVAGPGASTEPVVRLEPFDSVAFLIPLHDLPVQLRDEGRKRPTRVRGSIEVAGKRLRRRSSWRNALLLPPGSVSIQGNVPTVQEIAFRVAMLQRTSPENESGSLPPGFVGFLLRKADAAGTPLNLRTILDLLDQVDQPEDQMERLDLAMSIRDGLAAHGLTDETIPDDVGGAR